MPDILITRKVYTPKSTIGEVFVHGEFFCWSLEPPAVPGSRYVCIPAGRYPATVYRSPRLAHNVILLADVPGRSYIEIHPLNYPHETEGCIGVGHERGTDYLGSSRAAFDTLMAVVRPWELITVIVVDTEYPEDIRV